MIMRKKFVFDLDNTLVYTNSLNNESYNYALSILGLPKIDNIERITREIVFRKYPNIRITVRNEIITIKQEYFKRNLDKTVLNNVLLRSLVMEKKEDCILWTSANRNRVIDILEYYGIEKEFMGIIFGKKENIEVELKNICTMLKCNQDQITFYEDNKEVIIKLIELGANVVEI